jgi:hypothetical protein
MYKQYKVLWCGWVWFVGDDGIELCNHRFFGSPSQSYVFRIEYAIVFQSVVVLQAKALMPTLVRPKLFSAESWQRNIEVAVAPAW